MFYVYILKSKKDNKLYIGSTNDLRRRILEHSKGKVLSTRDRRPLELVYYEAYKNEHDSRLREQSFKNSGSVYNGLVKRIKESLK
jgi:putative endonuclease